MGLLMKRASKRENERLVRQRPLYLDMLTIYP